MPTLFSNTLIRDSATNANIRAWAQFVEDTLVTTGGWVVTPDTGQTLPSALLGCTGANQKRGYRIYRMADALQATAPVFMRIDFGCGGAVSTAGFWVTIGTGSDGAGNITDILWNGGAAVGPSVMNATSGISGATNSYGSADVNRASIAMFVAASAAYCTIFCIERTKNDLGQDTADGLLFTYIDTASQVTKTRYVVLTGGAQPTPESGLSYILTGRNPSETFTPGDIGVGIVIHFKGVSQQPGTNFMIVNSADVGVEGSFATILYGTTHTYQQLNAIVPVKALSGGIFSADNNARCCMRYD